MILAQASSPYGVSTVLFFGTLGLFIMAISVVGVLVIYQRKIINNQLRKIKLLVTKVKELEEQLPG